MPITVNTEEFKCNICKCLFDSKQKLGMHIRFKHNLTKKEYYIQEMYHNIIPKCKCGCGQEVSFISTYPYFRKYISGHNKNPMIGKKHTKESKEKMSKSAKKRVQELYENNETLPMHSKTAIKKRGKIYSDLMMKKKIKKFNIEFLNSYEERQSGIYKFKCNKCGSVYIQNHNKYYICSKCFPNVRSKDENELYNFIKDDLKLECIKNSRSIIKNYELDIFIPSLNIAIEYNGLYWHSENGGNKDRNYHLNKTIECEKAGIKLIQLFEDEWYNKKDLVKKKLIHILNLNKSEKIYARKCNIKEISNADKKEFLIKNHIQGNDSSKIALGCFYNDKLVSVMTFGKERLALGNKNVSENVFELVRFSSDNDYIVIGSANKLLKYFIKHYNPIKIITYADRRWSVGKLYEKLGFTKISDGTPNYWYTTYHFDRIHRFNFRKNILVEMGYSSDKTEWQIMQELGYDRIWDCGHLKYELMIQ